MFGRRQSKQLRAVSEMVQRLAEANTVLVDRVTILEHKLDQLIKERDLEARLTAVERRLMLLEQSFRVTKVEVEKAGVSV